MDQPAPPVAPPAPGLLSLDQQVALCAGADAWHTASFADPPLPALTLADGPHGLRVQPEQAQDSIGGSRPATCFPTASALASSFDPDLAHRIGVALGTEARAQGVHVVLGPGVNIKRSPLCGRNFEYLSEDPLLAGTLAAAMVRGIQSRGVGACVKHFAANNQETDRVRVSAEVDERTLREIYLPAFEQVVREAGVWTVMCAYNRVNGVYASQHRRLLTEVLRDEWGFDGVVMSDWGAVADRVAALEAGLDLEMPPNLGTSDRLLLDAVRSGRLDGSALHRSVERMLRLVDRCTAVDPVRADAAPDPTAEHHALAGRAAAQCLVLLSNDGVLPLAPGLRRVAVVGPFAVTPRFQGSGSSQVVPTRVDVPLEQLRARLPDTQVDYAPGVGLDPDDDHHALAARAVELAGDAEVVVAFLGLPEHAESEGWDREHIDLPAEQVALIQALGALDAPLVVVLANGSAVRTAPWQHHAAAVLETWLAGQAVGGAVADVLSGRTDPGGRLAESIPQRLADLPSTLNFPGEDGQVRYGEGVFVGYRGLDRLDLPVSFPFGHGLSYTTFRFGDLTARPAGDGSVQVRATVTNTGPRAGWAVPQLYVGDPVASVARPPRELRAFAKAWLEPGERRELEFRLEPRAFSHWSVRDAGWVCEPGEFTVSLGASSRDLHAHVSVRLDAPAPARELDGSSTLAEWLADPDGARRLRAVVGTDAEGRPAGILGNAEMLRMIGNFPISRMPAFPAHGLDAGALDRLLSG